MNDGQSISSSDYQDIEDAYAELLSDSLMLLDEVKEHTLSARRAMDLDPVDANTLANEQVELAILNQRLGDRAARAGAISRAAENHYKTVREEHKLRLVLVGEDQQVEVDDGATTRGKKLVTKKVKMAAGVADSAKMKLSMKEHDLYNMAEELREKLVFMRRSSDKTIDAIRSKLSYEKLDLKNS